MKKTLVSALTTALVIGAASTTFAASNPFSDVPADHWAYDAVSQLASDGVIEGYGDSTFQGNKNITRYEMAQMIAKAMAKSDVSAADKALIDKLAAEFSDELNNLGVRVSNLERNADQVKWNGEARYRYRSIRTQDANGTKNRTNRDWLLFRLDPSAEVNDHWHVNARLDATTELDRDAAGYRNEDGVPKGADEDKVTLKRIYAQGNYKNFQVRLGKQEFYSYESDGLTLDDEFSGAQVRLGNQLQAVLEAGRWSGESANTDLRDADNNFLKHIDEHAANYQGIALDYAGKKLNAGAAYRHFTSDAFLLAKKYQDHGTDDTANVWSVGAGYAFDHNWKLSGSYADNTTADNWNTAHSVQLDYKGAQKANAGTWGLYAAYRYLGENVAFAPTYDAAQTGTKGWEFGALYVPFHNVRTELQYFDGKDLANNQDANVLFGRVSFWF